MKKQTVSLTMLAGRSVIINSRYRLTYCKKYPNHKVVCTSMCDTYEGKQKCGNPCKVINKQYTFALLDRTQIKSKNFSPKTISILEHSGEYYEIDDDISISINEADLTFGFSIVFTVSDGVVINRECFEMAAENNFYDLLTSTSKKIIERNKNG